MSTAAFAAMKEDLRSDASAIPSEIDRLHASGSPAGQFLIKSHCFIKIARMDIASISYNRPRPKLCYMLGTKSRQTVVGCIELE